MPDSGRYRCPTCGGEKSKPALLLDDCYSQFRCPSPFHSRVTCPTCNNSGIVDTGDRTLDFDSGMYEPVERACPDCSPVTPEGAGLRTAPASAGEDLATEELLRERLIYAFSCLRDEERQLLTSALAGNHPEALAHVRPTVIRALALADRVVRHG